MLAGTQRYVNLIPVLAHMLSLNQMLQTADSQAMTSSNGFLISIPRAVV